MEKKPDLKLIVNEKPDPVSEGVVRYVMAGLVPRVVAFFPFPEDRDPEPPKAA